MSSERAYWIAFNHVKGIGSVRFRKLLTHFSNLSTAWQASKYDLIQAGLTDKAAQSVITLRQSFNPDHILGILEKKKIKTLIWEDTGYPLYLKEISQPPPVLYYKGEFKECDNLAVAIVGTRNVTPYGRQLTEDTSAYLAGNGVTIVSGLARGVDAIAHEGALKVGGRTIAVFGSGVDVIYPPEHRKLAERIIENGAIMSDYAPGTKPDAVNFPPRNRIISGLSRGTVVIEAGERSGALITAKFSLEQGREVFAVPGSVLAPMSKGTNNLLFAGATPMTNPKVVLESLNLPSRPQKKEGISETPQLEPLERRILIALNEGEIHIDELCEKLDLPIEKLSVALTMMELKSLVERSGGMEYRSVKDWTF